jgi:retron-type reverse transcriptase
MKRRKRDTTNLIERVLHSGNLTMACKEVVRNKGAGGVDGMKVSELKEYLDQQRSVLDDEIRNGRSMPQPLRG